MLKILSWNIQQGGGSRVMAITKAIVESNADIAVLSEFKNNDAGQTIRQYLLRYGYRFQFVSSASPEDNSVLIASKQKAGSEIILHADPVYNENIVVAHYQPFNIVGVYLPHKQKHGLFGFIKTMAEKSEKPLIIVGDYNSGINGLDQAGDSFWYEKDLKAWEEAGLKDAFRHIHGSKLAYSWYSHQGNGYRYDHSYVDLSLLPIVKDCYYMHDLRTSGISDHAPMVLTLG
jgi:exodeoxyribonuclease III